MDRHIWLLLVSFKFEFWANELFIPNFGIQNNGFEKVT